MSAQPLFQGDFPDGYPAPRQNQGRSNPNVNAPVAPQRRTPNVQGFVPSSFAHQAPNSSDFGEGFASGVYGTVISSIGTCLGFFGSIPCCFCFPNPYRVVDQGNVGLFTRFGKYKRTVDPGLQYTNLLTEKIKIVDVKMQVGDIPRQTVITKDNVTVSIDSVLYWHIIDPFTSVYQVTDVRTALIERTMTTLRQVFGTHDLQDAITHREGIAAEMEQIIGPAAESWGVRIESILIKDIIFSQELQENLSAAAKQRRLGASKVIAAQAEVESARLMRTAADILNSPVAMQMRYLETLKTMSTAAGSKVIFMPPSFTEVGGPMGNGSTEQLPPPLTPSHDKNEKRSSKIDGTQRAALLDTIANF